MGTEQRDSECRYEERVLIPSSCSTRSLPQAFEEGVAPHPFRPNCTPWDISTDAVSRRPFGWSSAGRAAARSLPTPLRPLRRPSAQATTPPPGLERPQGNQGRQSGGARRSRPAATAEGGTRRDQTRRAGAEASGQPARTWRGGKRREGEGSAGMATHVVSEGEARRKRKSEGRRRARKAVRRAGGLEEQN